MIPLYKLSGRLGNNMFQFAYIYAQMKRGLIPDVYVQSDEYFHDFADDIKRLYGQDIGYTDKVSLHIRRGDYVGNKFYVDLSTTDYYKKAMQMFEGEKFLVFSDDIKWCKEQPFLEGCDFFNSGDDIEDMNKMASCKYNIIANSSFSWWAAYINPNVLKRVVAPKLWYSDGVDRTICPSDWIRI